MPMSSYLKAITALGGGSLHPGGFTGTLGILRNFTIAQDEVILDLGCGTGRTASHLAKIYRAHVLLWTILKLCCLKRSQGHFRKGQKFILFWVIC